MSRVVLMSLLPTHSSINDRDLWTPCRDEMMLFSTDRKWRLGSWSKTSPSKHCKWLLLMLRRVRRCIAHKPATHQTNKSSNEHRKKQCDELMKVILHSSVPGFILNWYSGKKSEKGKEGALPSSLLILLLLRESSSSNVQCSRPSIRVNSLLSNEAQRRFTSRSRLLNRVNRRPSRFSAVIWPSRAKGKVYQLKVWLYQEILSSLAMFPCYLFICKFGDIYHIKKKRWMERSRCVTFYNTSSLCFPEQTQKWQGWVN